MSEERPRIIDAEFEVVDQPDTRRWWQGWRITFDWSVFWGAVFLGALSVLGGLAETLQLSP